jgi:hypothetical protein
MTTFYTGEELERRERAIVAAAVEDERKACEEIARRIGLEDGDDWGWAAEKIADAIAARKQP